MGDEIPYPFANEYGAAIEFLELISNSSTIYWSCDYF